MSVIHRQYIDNENVQKALDLTVEAISESRNNSLDYNHIIALELIERKDCKDMFGKPIVDGLYVRPVWSDNPQRDDGYYDICVEGCGCFGVLTSVWKWLGSKL